MNQIGVCEWSLPVSGPFSVNFAADVGFEGVQLGDLGGSTKGYPMSNRCIREGYIEAAANTGVKLHSMHLHTLVRQGGMIHPMHSPEGESAVASLKIGIESCAAMGIPCVNVSAFFKTFIKDDYDFDNFAAMLNFAVAYGADRGVGIVYEPILAIKDTLLMLDRVKGLRINYDTLNPLFAGSGDPQVEIHTLGSAVIDHVHVKDAKYKSDVEDPDNCLSGTGIGKLRESIHLLKELGYSGWYLSESNYVNPLPYGLGPDISEICRADIHALRELLETA